MCVHRKWKKTVGSILKFAAVGIPASAVNAGLKYETEMLALLFRRRLSEHINERYLGMRTTKWRDGFVSLCIVPAYLVPAGCMLNVLLWQREQISTKRLLWVRIELITPTSVSLLISSRSVLLCRTCTPLSSNHLSMSFSFLPVWYDPYLVTTFTVWDLTWFLTSRWE